MNWVLFFRNTRPLSTEITNDYNVIPVDELTERTSHLRFVNQTYITHMKHSLHYSWSSCKASFYFFIHAFYPDWFQHNGSAEITRINQQISQNTK
jgi:hypothetical protein